VSDLDVIGDPSNKLSVIRKLNFVGAKVSIDVAKTENLDKSSLYCYPVSYIVY